MPQPERPRGASPRLPVYSHLFFNVNIQNENDNNNQKNETPDSAIRIDIKIAKGQLENRRNKTRKLKSVLVILGKCINVFERRNKMRIQARFLVSLIALALVVSVSSVASADYGLISTPIDNILSYKNGLELSENQIAKLEKFNSEIVREMSEVKNQLALRKGEIDRYMADWSKVHGAATDHLITEYYDLQAKLKQLELEAIMKARGVLSLRQMKMFTELATIEALMLDQDPDQASAF